MPPLTILFDATASRTTTCLRRYKLSSIDGYKSKEPSIAIEYGVAFHKWIAARRSGKSQDDALEIARVHLMQPELLAIQANDFRNAAHLFDTSAKYCTEYGDFVNDTFQVGRDSGGKALVEQRFSWPFYQDDNIVVVGCGTIDAIGEYAGIGCYTDVKTTASYASTKYLEAYRLSQQMMFYRMMMDILAEKFPQTWGHMKDAPFFIDGVFISKSGAKFLRSELIGFHRPLMEEFVATLRQFFSRLSEAVKHNEFLPEGIINGSCETKFNQLCPFFKLCSEDRGAWDSILANDFKQETYDPRKFGE